MMLLLMTPPFKQTSSLGDEAHPVMSLQVEGEAIPSIRRGRMSPYAASLPNTRKKQVYVMLNEVKHLVL